jgi:alanine racemase
VIVQPKLETRRRLPEDAQISPCCERAPLRLRLDANALCDNWLTLARMSGPAACGAAVKADGYGLGSANVIGLLLDVGCRDFFVATWAEAARVDHHFRQSGATLSVLHGVRLEDMPLARALAARPVLNTTSQIRRWREAGGGPCDVMLDTGFNRLGLSPPEVTEGVLDGLPIETLMSHLASADENSDMNSAQRSAFEGCTQRVAARRLSLANSAGIALGPSYSFDLTRPGIALYGGVPREEFARVIKRVVTPQAQVLQRRHVPRGGTVGYNATWTAAKPTEIAILNIGYADGYPSALPSGGMAQIGDVKLPVIGRVSMDLLAIDVSAVPEITESDWVSLDYELASSSRLSGKSQYELLVALSRRFDRIWVT